MKAAALILVSLALLLGCKAPTPAPQKPKPVATHLVALPCDDRGPLRPVTSLYCIGQRHYMTRAANAAMLDIAAAFAQKHPGSQVLYMEASWPIGVRPMPPHFSHGDGKEIDLALYYEALDGKPLSKPPTANGYDAFEPPRPQDARVCIVVKSDHARPDPPANRTWRLDEARTAALVKAIIADKRVKRIFIEPHLKKRLGLASSAKVRFAGCKAARHDDHIHVDFY